MNFSLALMNVCKRLPKMRWITPSSEQSGTGAAVLINIPTGEILSMASYPDFNPNNREGAQLDDFRNRAISDTFEPGSTVKPLVIMTALQQGIVQPDSVIDTHPFTLDGHRIRDVGYYPELTLTGILQNPAIPAFLTFLWRCRCRN